MNPMSALSLTSRLIRASAAALAVALVATPVLLAGPAGAKAPDGSQSEVILETRNVTGQPARASLNGWWGHEGGKDDTGRRPTFLSMDASDGHGVVDDATTAALHERLHDGGSFDTLRVAFVPYTADGSNERPKVTKGENAGEAFAWFADLGFGNALNGTTNRNDAVNWVSALDEYRAWWQAGRPVQGFTDQLKVLDIADDGSTRPAAKPQGRSILNRWPAGKKISLVFYVSDGVDKDMPQVPTVKVGPDGRALTSWLTFETVASPTNAARTSGGYRVLTGAGTGPEAASPKSTSNGQGSSTAGGTGTTPETQETAGPSSAAHGDGGHEGSTTSRLMSSLPGGSPTFWVLVGLVVLGAVGLVTSRFRALDAASPARSADQVSSADHVPH
jgi:hypothetical protein